ncbi:MAG: hypothetical protein K2Y56_14475 [Methylobacterium sp.]|uniref:hypothetical protein n=1 Tax=Methylobacterium sp. TaxID=409 RepID=UPI0025D85F7F|nr:hypothetical protein [Methylobacterium sp.]MBX9932725.1 hypothetical protein [Methylobacterium sp.]
MTDIYAQHRKAFANVSAYVVLKDGERVATVAFKFGNTVTAYVHWIGTKMARGRAVGGGYDRQTAAVQMAVKNAKAQMDDAAQDPMIHTNAQARALGDFRFAVLAGDDGQTWARNLEKAGFTVLSAV